jgi:transcriptional regulator with XRE-family HTH domain
MSERAMLRRRAGLTQAELAYLAGVHAPQICLWERGQIELKEEQVERIAAVLRGRIAYWLKSLAGEQQHAVSQ